MNKEQSISNREKEGETMSNNTSQSGYKKIDLSSLIYSDEILSFDDVLADIDPIQIDENFKPKKNIKITKAEKDYDNRCVKLEISY